MHDHHDHDHNHHHGHGHHHHHGGNIRVAFWLNTGFAILELIGGFYTNSVAILSDALHDLGDSLSLGTAWYFERKSKQKRDAIYTYGYQRFSLVWAFINSIILIVGSVLILKEAFGRLFAPEHPDTTGMMIFAVFGILVNGAAMLRLKRGESINEKVISLHFLEDVLGWAAANGLPPAGLIRSPIKGAEGNVEFLAWLRPGITSGLEVSAAIGSALNE